MERGIQASVERLELVKKALKLKGWTQEYLADASGCTRQTVSRFLGGKVIEKRIFQTICTGLELEWGKVVEQESIKPIDQIPSIDELYFDLELDFHLDLILDFTVKLSLSGSDHFTLYPRHNFASEIAHTLLSNLTCALDLNNSNSDRRLYQAELQQFLQDFRNQFLGKSRSPHRN